MYSQNNEEQVILEVFAHASSGRFLDIGAFNGKTFSNTLALVKLGWEGVCIEPSPKPFLDLLVLHKDNPKIQCVNAAVTIENENQLTKFWCSIQDCISSLSEAHKEKWTKGSSTVFYPYYLTPISLDSVFSTFGYNFDFINLDIEGFSGELALKLPLDKLASTCLCIEHDNKIKEIEKFTKPFGYTTRSINGENIILAK